MVDVRIAGNKINRDLLRWVARLSDFRASGDGADKRGACTAVANTEDAVAADVATPVPQASDLLCFSRCLQVTRLVTCGIHTHLPSLGLRGRRSASWWVRVDGERQGHGRESPGNKPKDHSKQSRQITLACRPSIKLGRKWIVHSLLLTNFVTSESGFQRPALLTKCMSNASIFIRRSVSKHPHPHPWNRLP